VIVGCDKIPKGVALDHNTLVAVLSLCSSVTLQFIDGGDLQSTALKLFNIHHGSSAVGVKEVQVLELLIPNNPDAVDEAYRHYTRLQSSLPSVVEWRRVKQGHATVHPSDAGCTRSVSM
jgi:hypothetical protein